MSDEQSTPNTGLRLKPRLRPPEGQADPATPAGTPPANPAAEPTPPAGAGEAPRIRLKPRLMTDTSASAATPAAPEPAAQQAPEPPAPAPAAPPTPPPGAADTPPAPAAGEAPRIKLKPRIMAEPSGAPTAAAAGPAAPPVPPLAPESPPAASAPAPAAPPPPPVAPPAAPPSPAAAVPAVPAAPAPAAGGEGAKFKLKPKVPLAPAAQPAGAAAPPPPPASSPAAPPSVAAPLGTPPPPDKTLKVPPPFPVVAPAAASGTTPPIPQVAAPAVVAEAQTEVQPTRVPIWKKKSVQLGGLAALLVLGAGGYFALALLEEPPPPPPPPAVKKKAAPVANAPAQPAGAGTTAASASPTPSETLNALAQAPGNAINKAQAVVGARQAAGQSDVGAATGDDLANKPAVGGGRAGPQRTSSAGVMNVAPGLSATTPLEATPEASPAFRAFVNNAKVISVIGGANPKATVNGRVLRPGESVDSGLGIVLDAIEQDTRLLVFKDRSGAIVARRY